MQRDHVMMAAPRQSPCAMLSTTTTTHHRPGSAECTSSSASSCSPKSTALHRSPVQRSPVATVGEVTSGFNTVGTARDGSSLYNHSSGEKTSSDDQFSSSQFSSRQQSPSSKLRSPCLKKGSSFSSSITSGGISMRSSVSHSRESSDMADATWRARMHRFHSVSKSNLAQGLSGQSSLDSLCSHSIVSRSDSSISSSIAAHLSHNASKNSLDFPWKPYNAAQLHNEQQHHQHYPRTQQQQQQQQGLRHQPSFPLQQRCSQPLETRPRAATVDRGDRYPRYQSSSCTQLHGIGDNTALGDVLDGSLTDRLGKGRHRSRLARAWHRLTPGGGGGGGSVRSTSNSSSWNSLTAKRRSVPQSPRSASLFSSLPSSNQTSVDSNGSTSIVGTALRARWARSRYSDSTSGSGSCTSRSPSVRAANSLTSINDLWTSQLSYQHQQQQPQQQQQQLYHKRRLLQNHKRQLSQPQLRNAPHRALAHTASAAVSPRHAQSLDSMIHLPLEGCCHVKIRHDPCERLPAVRQSSSSSSEEGSSLPKTLTTAATPVQDSPCLAPNSAEVCGSSTETLFHRAAVDSTGSAGAATAKTARSVSLSDGGGSAESPALRQSPASSSPSVRLRSQLSVGKLAVCDDQPEQKHRCLSAEVASLSGDSEDESRGPSAPPAIVSRVRGKSEGADKDDISIPLGRTVTKRDSKHAELKLAPAAIASLSHKLHRSDPCIWYAVDGKARVCANSFSMSPWLPMQDGSSATLSSRKSKVKKLWRTVLVARRIIPRSSNPAVNHGNGASDPTIDRQKSSRSSIFSSRRSVAVGDKDAHAAHDDQCSSSRTPLATSLSRSIAGSSGSSAIAPDSSNTIGSSPAATAADRQVDAAQTLPPESLESVTSTHNKNWRTSEHTLCGSVSSVPTGPGSISGSASGPQSGHSSQTHHITSIVAAMKKTRGGGGGGGGRAGSMSPMESRRHMSISLADFRASCLTGPTAESSAPRGGTLSGRVSRALGAWGMLSRKDSKSGQMHQVQSLEHVVQSSATAATTATPSKQTRSSSVSAMKFGRRSHSLAETAVSTSSLSSGLHRRSDSMASTQRGSRPSVFFRSLGHAKRLFRRRLTSRESNNGSFHSGSSAGRRNNSNLTDDWPLDPTQSKARVSGGSDDVFADSAGEQQHSGSAKPAAVVAQPPDTDNNLQFGMSASKSSWSHSSSDAAPSTCYNPGLDDLGLSYTLPASTNRSGNRQQHLATYQNMGFAQLQDPECLLPDDEDPWTDSPHQQSKARGAKTRIERFEETRGSPPQSAAETYSDAAEQSSPPRTRSSSRDLAATAVPPPAPAPPAATKATAEEVAAAANAKPKASQKKRSSITSTFRRGLLKRTSWTSKSDLGLAASSKASTGTSRQSIPEASGDAKQAKYTNMQEELTSEISKARSRLRSTRTLPNIKQTDEDGSHDQTSTPLPRTKPALPAVITRREQSSAAAEDATTIAVTVITASSSTALLKQKFEQMASVNAVQPQKLRGSGGSVRPQTQSSTNAATSFGAKSGGNSTSGTVARSQSSTAGLRKTQSMGFAALSMDMKARAINDTFGSATGMKGMQASAASTASSRAALMRKQRAAGGGQQGSTDTNNNTNGGAAGCGGCTACTVGHRAAASASTTTTTHADSATAGGAAGGGGDGDHGNGGGGDQTAITAASSTAAASTIAHRTVSARMRLGSRGSSMRVRAGARERITRQQCKDLMAGNYSSRFQTSSASGSGGKGAPAEGHSPLSRAKSVGPPMAISEQGGDDGDANNKPNNNNNNNSNSNGSSSSHSNSNAMLQKLASIDDAAKSKSPVNSTLGDDGGVEIAL